MFLRGRQGGAELSRPSEAEVEGYFESLSNWGRWGEDDSLGTLNHITPEARAAAAALVERGEVISCAWDIEPERWVDHRKPPAQRYFVHTGQGLSDPNHVCADYMTPTDRQAAASEYIGMEYHGYAHTHVDALSHIFWDGQMYNGRSSELVTASRGALAHSVHLAGDGIVARGVLVDAARHRGVDTMRAGEGVEGHELEAILDTQGVELRAGDVLLLRTGVGAAREQGDLEIDRAGQPGWQASCLPVFHRAGVAAVGADTSQDAIPSGYAVVRFPIHAVGIVAMGMYLIDNCRLERLASRCAELGRWEFLLTVSMFRMVGGSGSPVNPLAVL